MPRTLLGSLMISLMKLCKGGRSSWTFAVIGREIGMLEISNMNLPATWGLGVAKF